MLKVAVVGAGYIGLAHIAAYKACPEAKVIAVVDMSEQNREKGRLAAGDGCRAYATLEDALAAGEIHVADVCLPTNMHESFVVKAANAGCHVLCEKPVTFDLPSFDRMAGACGANGVKFMVAQVARWWPEFKEITRTLKEGQLGPIHMIYEKRLAQHPNWAAWHRRPEVSGGGLYDINIHDIDYLYSVFGMPRRVYASGWKSPTGCWNHVATTLSWADGTSAVVETSLEMTGDFPFSIEFRATGDRGTLAYAFTAGHNILDGNKGSSMTLYPTEGEAQPVAVEQTDMFAEEIGAFLKAVAGGTEVPVPPAQSRDVLRITLAIKESLENSRAVELLL